MEAESGLGRVAATCSAQTVRGPHDAPEVAATRPGPRQLRFLSIGHRYAVCSRAVTRFLFLSIGHRYAVCNRAVTRFLFLSIGHRYAVSRPGYALLIYR